MTLYDHGPDHNFVSMQESDNLFVAGTWQTGEPGFNPKFALAVHQVDQEVDDSGEIDCEEDSPLASDATLLKVAEAYSQGYLNGQQAIAVQLDESEERQKALAQAISRLKPVDEAKLAKQLWEAVLSLFRQAVGNAKIDDALMQQRCEEAVKSIDSERGESCLYVAPADVEFLRSYDCAIPIVADPELLPGSVYLDSESGQLTSGTLSIEQDIASRIGLDGGATC
ncbi:FliH/SctL family protein [Parasphingorhabdus sp. JC815]|uniref:FliH/SctL family protein n=1 Tax=Parasphingorhabdus sp. JC815 TaxID=3232140 RepID=UPI003458AF69